MSKWLDAKLHPPINVANGFGSGPGGLSAEVLVAVSCDNGLRFVGIDQFDPHTGSWLNHTEQSGQYVTHWMQVPNLPKEEHNEP